MRLQATAQYKPRGDLGRYVDVHIVPGVRASVEAVCRMVQTAAKFYVPVDTGLLQSRIVFLIVETGKTIVGTVFVDGVLYAGFVEFGTRFMAAQPFMRPAVDETQEPAHQVFRGNIALGLR